MITPELIDGRLSAYLVSINTLAALSPDEQAFSKALGESRMFQYYFEISFAALCTFPGGELMTKRVLYGLLVQAYILGWQGAIAERERAALEEMVEHE